IFMPDHLGGQLAPVPALVTAAEACDLRIGVFVFGNDFRHPVVLAKEAATLDLLSEGRLELGIGAGWLRSDYEGSGIPFDPPGRRVDRLEEAVAILKGLFAEGPFSFEGTHYTVTNLDGRPKPLQRPHPPLLIGGGGRRILDLAAREADIVGINPNLKAGEISPLEQGIDSTAAATRRKVEWVRRAAGERFDDLELNVLIFFAIVTNQRREQAEMIGAAGGMGADQVLGTPHLLVGTVDQICEDLEQRREAFGISYPVLNEASFEVVAPVVDRLTGT
ncbi:MAG: TIGR03621 family F420-dependent LLM class oxidoreductase, partial [Acidimicrobiia bacterium]